MVSGLLSGKTIANDKVDAEAMTFFESEVRPLLSQHCHECHSGDEPDGGLSLDRHQAILRGGDSGPAVVPGDPNASLLISAVNYQDL